MEGVSEQHIVGMSAGLSLHGLEFTSILFQLFLKKGFGTNYSRFIFTSFTYCNHDWKWGWNRNVPLGQHTLPMKTFYITSVPNINIFIPCGQMKLKK